MDNFLAEVSAGWRDLAPSPSPAWGRSEGQELAAERQRALEKCPVFPPVPRLAGSSQEQPLRGGHSVSGRGRAAPLAQLPQITRRFSGCERGRNWRPPS